MKFYSIVNLALVVLIVQVSIPTANAVEGELIIHNKTNGTLVVEVYPVGAIFNGNKQYLLKCVNSRLGYYDKIFGGVDTLTSNENFILDHDGDLQYCCEGEKSIGYGKYRVEFYQDDSISGYCYVDYSDSDYPYGSPFTADIHLYYFAPNDVRPWDISQQMPSDNVVKIWDQRVLNPASYKSPNKSGFSSSFENQVFPVNAADSGASNHISPNSFYLDLNVKNSGASFVSNADVIFSNCDLIVLDGYHLNLGQICKIVLENNACFRVFQTSGFKLVTMGTNSSIEIEGGNLNLNNTKFELATGATSWKGITLTNTGLDTIKNCTFSGADTIIRIYNSNKCFARNKKIITGSRFNNGIVRLSNVFRALISNDTFATSNSSHYLLTVSNSVHPNDENIYCDEEESPSPMFNLNIVGNVFTGGSVQLYLNCLASDFTPFYVFGNTFSGNTNTTGIVCNKVSGDIKYNIVGGTASLSNVILLQSNVNFFGNVFSSGNNVNLGINSSSTGTFSPFTSMGNDYWIGGLNVISSEDDNNIYYTGASDISMKNGHNCLSIANLYKYHLRGILTGKCDTAAFDATYNHWSVEPPVHLITCNSTSKALNYFPSAGGCGYAIDQSGSEIVDREDGVIDTLMLSVSEESEEEGEESDYVRSLMFKRQGNPDSAKACLENLLEQGTNTDFVCRAVEELYLVSELRDTLIVNPQTSSIYSSLKYELENLIQNNPLDSRIVERAYSVLLMCLTKLRDYSHALSGYDNIIENHPDPVRRMTASWDRAAVLLMMNGTGGGESGSDKSESTSNSEIQDDPIHKIATNVFRSLEYEEKMTMTKEQMTLHRIHETSRLKFRPADKRALESRISEDLELIIGAKEINTQEQESPLNSGLIVHQNYPNPFNPVTSIVYELPEPSKVYAKVYDNTGREVEVLFSGFKQKGRHTLTFNGSRLSSGVYYLKIGNGKTFVMRKLILIK